MDKKTNLIVGFIFLIGIILRFIVFKVNACYIHDDAALAVNIVNKSYLELFKGLEYCQVSPPLSLITLFIPILRVDNLPNYRNNPAQYLNNEEIIDKAYVPFYPVYKWYTHLE